MYVVYVCGCMYTLMHVPEIALIFQTSCCHHALLRPITLKHACMNEDSMKKLQGDCVSWLVLLTGFAQLLLVCGKGVFSY